MHKNDRSKDHQKGAIQIILIIGIVAALAVIGYVLYTQRLNSLGSSKLYSPASIPSQYQGQYKASGQAVAPIQNSKDLSGASTNLDSTDLTKMDAELNSLNQASSEF